MTQSESLLAIGIMTGNSLDGADLVLTRFHTDGRMEDLCAHYERYPDSLREELKELRVSVMTHHGDVKKVDKSFRSKSGKSSLAVEDSYTKFLAHCVENLISKAKERGALNEDTIDVIGSHGQTCAHYPPSVIERGSLKKPYTIQLGNGQKLADITGITVVSDFRSDDIFNGGEGAPLAPAHHKHLALQLKKQSYFPIAFVNGGNTGNMSLITRKKNSDKAIVLGWDAGPFNHFPDLLMQKEKGELFDKDAIQASKGTVNLSLLEELFNTAVVTESAENFLLQAPPRSSDPQWYRTIDSLTGNNINIPFYDRLRTALYFSVYTLFHSLTLISEEVVIPHFFAVSGGGWKNPLYLPHFKALLTGDEALSPVLDVHKGPFRKLRERINCESLTLEHSQYFGIDGTAMEARLFADAAVSKLKDLPFSFPDTTGVRSPCILGVVQVPDSDLQKASTIVKALIQQHKHTLAQNKSPWNRASG